MTTITKTVLIEGDRCLSVTLTEREWLGIVRLRGASLLTTVEFAGAILPLIDCSVPEAYLVAQAAGEVPPL